MEVFSSSFLRGIFLLGVFFLKEISCQEFPIIHIDPAPFSSIFEDERLMRGLSRSLSEVQPVLLQTFPDPEFYHLYRSSAGARSFSTSAPSKNTRPNVEKPAIFPLPTPHSFPPLRELGPKFPTPRLIYGFIPSGRKSSTRHEDNSSGKFPALRSDSAIQNLKLQKIERDNQREQEEKSKEVSALRHGPSPFSSSRSHWDDSRSDSDAEGGRESAGREEISRNALKKPDDKRTTRRPLSFVNFVLRDTPAYRVNESLPALEADPQTKKKRFLVFKAAVPTKRATSFFRNVPQGSPRDVAPSTPEPAADEGKTPHLHYEEDPFGDVTEVYSREMGGNSSLHPVSSSSSASYAVQQMNERKSQRKKSEIKKPSLKKSAPSKSTEDNGSVSGQPGTDYPNYYEIPQTNFDCREFHVPGFYADVEADCQVFHNCDVDLQKHSFLCPNGTVFRQELFVCDWWYNVRCEDSPDLYIRP